MSSMSAVSVSFDWPLAAASWAVACSCFLSSLHVLQHRTGAYGARNWTIMFVSALLFTFAIFTSTAVSLLSVTLSSSANSSLPLTVNALLLSFAFLIPFIFILFGLFLAGHPDSHRYLRLPIGTTSIAIGATVAGFLTMMALHSLASFTLSAAYVAGVVAVGMVGVGAVMYVWLREQRRVKVGLGATACASAVLAVLVVTMHMLALEAMKWTYDSTQSLSSPLHPLIIPLVLFAVLSFVALLASVGVSYYVQRKEGRSQTSHTVTLSAFIMDDHHRVLVTATGSLPSVRIENVHLGQGALSHLNKDFLLLLSTSTHWSSAFTTLQQLTAEPTDPTAAPAASLVYGQFLHACVQLAHNLQLPLPQLGLLYRQPIDDRLVLVSHALHAGRLSDVGGYRWVAKEVVDAWMRREHGKVGLRGDQKQEKFVRVLGEDTVESDECGWVKELETYDALYQLDVGQQLKLSDTIDIVIPAMPSARAGGAVEVEMVKPVVVEKMGETTRPAALSIPSPRGRSSTLPGFKNSMAVTPVSAAHVDMAIEEHAERRAQSTVLTVREEDARTAATATATQPQPPASPSHNRSATSPTIFTTPVLSTIDSPPARDNSRLYIGMFLAKITGQQLSVVVQRNGPSHMVPCVRLRLQSSEPKEELSEAEREWMSSIMSDERMAALPIVQHFHDFPRRALLTSSTPLSRFQNALFTAVSELGTLLGGGKHLTFSRLLSLHPISVSASVQMLVFCESVMTPHFPLGYDRSALTFVPAKVFESLHCGRWRACQPKDWISRALLSTARSYDKRRAYLDSRATFLNPADTNPPPPTHTQTRTQDSRITQTQTPPTYSRALSSHTNDRLLRSAPVSKPASGVVSPVASKSPSRRTSMVGYEMRERQMVVGGEMVVVMEVVDVLQAQEKEERRRRRREKKQRRAEQEQVEEEEQIEARVHV